MDYGFTTVPSDISEGMPNFLQRVGKEAKKQDAFLMIPTRDTTKGEKRVFVLVHQDALTHDALRGKELLSYKMNSHWGNKIPGTNYRGVYLEDRDFPRLIAAVRHELHRAKNLLTGRTLRVTVEAV